MAIDYNPLFEQVDKATLASFRKQERSVESTAMVWVIGIVMALFGFFFAVSAIAAEASSGARPERIAIIIAIVVAVGLVAVLVLRAVSRASALRRYRLTRFAVTNGMLYSATATRPAFDGTIFRVGSSRTIAERLWREPPEQFEVGNYQYTTGSGKNKSTHHWSYLATRLPRRLPHMLLDAKGNNSLFGSNLPISFHRDQRLSLEGDFDTHFTLYCPREYETDALYVFTPDLMAQFIDEAQAFDVEIVDDWMFVYAHRKLDLSDPHQLAPLLRIVDTVAKKTQSRSARYADDRVWGDTTEVSESSPTAPVGAARLSHNLIAAPGRRLKSTTPWVLIALGIIGVAAWYYLNTAFF